MKQILSSVVATLDSIISRSNVNPNKTPQPIPVRAQNRAGHLRKNF